MALVSSSDKSIHQSELQSITLPICYLSRQQASEGSLGCCNLMLHVLPFKRVIQTGLPSLPEENKAIKDGDWHGLIWRTDCGKSPPTPSAKMREGSQAHPEPAWPCVTVGLESHCEAWRGNTSHSYSSPERSHTDVGQGQLEDIVGGGRTREVRGGRQERWLRKAHRVRQEVATLA